MSLNAVIGDDGIVSKAMEANEKMKLAQVKEDLDYMFFGYNAEIDNEKSISQFLNEKVDTGEIESFKVYPMNGKLMMVIEKDKNYFYVEKKGEYYNATLMEKTLDDIQSGFTVVTEDSFSDLADGSMQFNLEGDASATLIFYDEINDAFNFVVNGGNVTIYVTNDMTLTNKGMSRSALEIASGATLNLYVYEGKTLTVDSGYGEDADKTIPGKGGYAGIHVPVGATLNLYGEGTVCASGGDAGDGGTGYGNDNGTGGAGGGGAGAGIGGNGGNGGKKKTGQGDSGGAGDDCGTIGIYNSIKVYAYGGAGGSGGPGDASNCDATGGGGYPGAGIGGGGAGGAGATCCAGGGGYSGGTKEYLTYEAKNGHAGGAVNSNPWSGGGYFDGAVGKDDNNLVRETACLGGFSGQGAWGITHTAGNGGKAGNGGTVKTSENAKIYAYNGNRYSDGTDYEEGKNQTPIYCQAGIINAKYVYSNKYGSSHTNFEKFELVLIQARTTIEKLNYINTAYTSTNKIESFNDVLKDVDMSTQGIGSGAGYVEISNGTYTIDSSMN